MGVGLIPAHAGKTCVSASMRSKRRAHPRSRGENSYHAQTLQLQGGSSPLTRGKRAAHPVWTAGHRLIPAHAGKTSGSLSRFRLAWAHPRSRGENSSCFPDSYCHEGSSPLTRGKRRPGARGQKSIRLIPAHAGKTVPGHVLHAWHWAHPRSRGENGFPSSYWAHANGSSPLTRGKRTWCHAWRQPARLIPTHAGKTAMTAFSAAHATAHPHSRGENPVCGGHFSVSFGSSPLTRGKRRRSPPSARPRRLIPTHAGKTHFYPGS